MKKTLKNNTIKQAENTKQKKQTSQQAAMTRKHHISQRKWLVSAIKLWKTSKTVILF